MKLFCICDNIDTHMGMRLAGIEGVVVHTKQEMSSAFSAACADSAIGVIMVSQKLVHLSYDEIYYLKLSLKRPLIVEIPDRHGGWDIGDNIARYVEEAIGIRI